METKTGENLLIEMPDPTRVRIVINRPKALNALNRATLLELDQALSALPATLRVLILTGGGEKAFIAGADIAEMSAFSPADALEFSKLGHRVLDRLEALEVPVIAEVNGYALGGGCEVVLATDFAIASDNAKLGQPEVGLGVTAGFGGTTRLLRRVGPARALQLLYTGEQIGAEEAKAIGLVNEVVPRAELRARVDAIADKIVKNAPLAVALSKRSAKRAAETDLATANAFEQQIFAMCFTSADQREGMKAFVEKRKAVWTGR